MGLIRKKEAIAFFGNQEALNGIIALGVFENSGINLSKKDYSVIDDVVSEIKENKNIEYILISSEIFRDDEKEKKDIILKIRSVSQKVMIVLFMINEAPDDTFLSWAYGHKVYNVYYSLDGDFNFEKITRDMLERGIPDFSDYAISETERVKLAKGWQELKEKEEYLKEQEEEVKVLRENLASIEKGEDERSKNNASSSLDEIRKLKEELSKYEKETENAKDLLESVKKEHEREKEEIRKKAEKEKERIELEAKKRIERAEKEAGKTKIIKSGTNPTQIGIFSLSSGSGSTYISINLAERYARAGYKVAVVSYDDKNDFEFIGKGKADKYSASKEDRKTLLLAVLSMDYDYIIIDFGKLIPILPSGRLDIENGIVSIRDDLGELTRCDYKVGITFSEAWHIGRLDYFKNNALFDENTLFAIKDLEKANIPYSFKHPVCERNAKLIFKTLLSWQNEDVG